MSWRPDADLNRLVPMMDLSGLSPEKKKALFKGMNSTPEGKAHLSAMKQAKADFADMIEGATMRMTVKQYKQYLKDGEV